MRKHVATYLLLLVLIPLLNLGPSLHRLTCFGLHGDSCCRLFDDSSSSRPDCCCDHHSSYTDTKSDQNKSQLTSSLPHSDCLLCRFFANFNAIQPNAGRICADFPFCEVLTRVPDLCVCAVITDHARGPPVFLSLHSVDRVSARIELRLQLV
jgi:hypothetical protein